MRRLRQLITVLVLVWLSWLLMMLFHEFGHILGAWSTGGEVGRVAWFPLRFSQTEVFPNPNPAVVVWAGPVVGVLLPLALAMSARYWKCAWAYAADFVVGFCGLANGVYIGSGPVAPVGDALEMQRLGAPAGVMLLFGGTAFVIGLWRLDVASVSLGFGKDSMIPSWVHTLVLVAVGMVVTAVSFVVGGG